MKGNENWMIQKTITSGIPLAKLRMPFNFLLNVIECTYYIVYREKIPF